MSIDPSLLQQLIAHLEAAAALLRQLQGQETSGSFKRGGLSYDQLRALARPPRKETR